MPLAALAVVAVTSVSLMVLGRRFSRRYVDQKGTLPPMTWMFRRTDDPVLEDSRRLALRLLPIYGVALLLYLVR